MSEHTAEPWTLSRHEVPAGTPWFQKPHYTLYAPGVGAGWIVGHYIPAMFVTGAEAEANARLIAAAPNLLAALEAMLDKLGGDMDMHLADEKAQARAAIAEAKEGA